MVDRISEIKKNDTISKIVSRMESASANLEAFSDGVLVVYQLWQQYLATSPTDADLADTGSGFSDMCRDLIDKNKEALASAFDIVAAGTYGEGGDVLTRDELLAEIAAVE